MADVRIEKDSLGQVEVPANAYYGALATRISQVMAGELSLDEAYERMNQDIADQVAQAQQ